MQEIILHRKKELNNKGRDYKILLNDKSIGEIKSDEESKKFIVPQKKGKLKVKIDWCYSNEVNIIENKEFIVSSSINNATFLFITLGCILSVILYFYTKITFIGFIPLILLIYPVYKITFDRNNYLSLKNN